MSLNLHRLDTKIAPDTLDSLPYPSNCEFHIMDNMCDPESWTKPILSSRYSIHRTIGLHPKYSAPEEFFEELPNTFKKLLDTNFFSAISTGVENHSKSITSITSLYTKGHTKLPLYLHSRNDTETLKALNSEHFTKMPIIWQNINLGTENRYKDIIDTSKNTSLQNFLESNENHFLCVNPLINSHPIHKLKHLIKPALIDRILPSTDAPHNVFTQKNINKAAYNQPINIVRTIIQLHYQLTYLKNFKNYNLYDTNDWFFNKCINIFPSPQMQSATQYKILAKPILSNIFENWSKRLKYDRIPTKSTFETDKHYRDTNTLKSATNNIKPSPESLKSTACANITKEILETSTQTNDIDFTCKTCTKHQSMIFKNNSTQTFSELYPVKTPTNRLCTPPIPNQETTPSLTPIEILSEYTIDKNLNINLNHLTSLELDIQLSPRPTSTIITKPDLQQTKENIPYQTEGNKNFITDKKRRVTQNNNNSYSFKKTKTDITNQPTIIQSFVQRTSLDERFKNIKTNQDTNSIEFLNLLDENFFDS